MNKSICFQTGWYKKYIIYNWLAFYYLFLFDFGTIPAVWYFLFLILLHVNYVVYILLWINSLTNFACLFWLESKISYDPMNNIAAWLILKCQPQIIYMNVKKWPWMSFIVFSCWFHYNSLAFHFQVTPLPSVVVSSVF